MQVDIVMRNFGKMSLLSELEDSELPQLVMGRILPVSKLLTAPISGKPCVYYDVRVEQLVELTDENGLSGEVEGNKVWEYRCGETVAADFTLSDPFSPSDTLYVPGAQVQIQVHATEDVRAGRSKIIKHTKVPHHTLVRAVIAHSPSSVRTNRVLSLAGTYGKASVFLHRFERHAE
jgi:hypothetical protein